MRELNAPAYDGWDELQLQYEAEEPLDQLLTETVRLSLWDLCCRFAGDCMSAALPLIGLVA